MHRFEKYVFSFQYLFICGRSEMVRSSRIKKEEKRKQHLHSVCLGHQKPLKVSKAQLLQTPLDFLGDAREERSSETESISEINIRMKYVSSLPKMHDQIFTNALTFVQFLDFWGDAREERNSDVILRMNYVLSLLKMRDQRFTNAFRFVKIRKRVAILRSRSLERLPRRHRPLVVLVLLLFKVFWLLPISSEDFWESYDVSEMSGASSNATSHEFYEA